MRLLADWSGRLIIKIDNAVIRANCLISDNGVILRGLSLIMICALAVIRVDLMNVHERTGRTRLAESCSINMAIYCTVLAECVCTKVYMSELWRYCIFVHDSGQSDCVYNVCMIHSSFLAGGSSA